MISLKQILTEKTVSDPIRRSMIEKAFKSLGISKDELEGWSKPRNNGYFIKGEFDKGITIYKNDNHYWYIGIDDDKGRTSKLKNLPDTFNKIKEIIDDYYFDINHK